MSEKPELPDNVGCSTCWGHHDRHMSPCWQVRKSLPEFVILADATTEARYVREDSEREKLRDQFIKYAFLAISFPGSESRLESARCAYEALEAYERGAKP